MGTSVATLRLLSAARHPAAAARPRNFAHAAVRATPSVHSTHRRDRVVAWTTRWNLGRNLTVTRAVAEPHSGSSPNDDETDETEDDDDEASFDDDDYDDEDGGMDGDDTFVKMSQTELIMMTPEQRKEYHRRSVLEGQIRARNKRERQKVRTPPVTMPGRTRTPDFDVRKIRAHGTSPRRVVRFRVINQYWHQPETKLGSMGNDPVIEENSFVSVGAERLMMEANSRLRPTFYPPRIHGHRVDTRCHRTD